MAKGKSAVALFEVIHIRTSDSSRKTPEVDRQ